MPRGRKSKPVPHLARTEAFTDGDTKMVSGDTNLVSGDTNMVFGDKLLEDGGLSLIPEVPTMPNVPLDMMDATPPGSSSAALSQSDGCLPLAILPCPKTWVTAEHKVRHSRFRTAYNLYDLLKEFVDTKAAEGIHIASNNDIRVVTIMEEYQAANASNDMEHYEQIVHDIFATYGNLTRVWHAGLCGFKARVTVMKMLFTEEREKECREAPRGSVLRL